MTKAKKEGENVRKIFIIDTNVLLDDPQALFSFDDNDVVVPIVVIDEIDNKKGLMNETGRNARRTIRMIDNFRAEGNKISEGVVLPGGGTIRIEINNDKELGDKSVIGNLDLSKNDNRILLVAANLSAKESKKDLLQQRKVVIVSNDGALRVKAEAVNLRAEEYKTNIVDFDQLYSGLSDRVETAPDEVLDQFFNNLEAKYVIEGLIANQYIEIVGRTTGHRAMVRYNNGNIFAVNKNKVARVYDLKSRNPGQNYAIDLLTNKEIGMVTLVGPAGTGKTLLAIAAGLEKVYEGEYDRLVVTRPIRSVGEDMGYLPGDIDSKIEPWMRPIFDAIELLTANSSKRRRTSFADGQGNPVPAYKQMILDGLLEIQPLAYVRGVTFPNQYFVVDETQNLTPHEVKTLATRVGEGTKIVLTGDPNQIDNPYLSRDTNGLTYFVDRLKGQVDYGHITLTQGERSRIATICSQLL
ncbi:MAG: PhoH family protein [bacterium]